ncbi:hypothetical protein F4553_006890 [Allocatelliglobosispora scoriae]|uniref:Uncharacterized protein n=1 Tax=Allocatelliglobosispora scoriae TaxID=643052 RepID=A0A841C0S7_9ACTN|nr:hypothetical protein [Allocatelliglobosispora scoriae]MBB5873456.1 hypothetical protein [Allocatelliglobosispora scoriae]
MERTLRPALPIRTELLILEYEQLKEEQRQRITSRDNLVYATLVAVGAIGAAALQTGLHNLLLLLPPVCIILGWTHASNDRKVWEIGGYIRRSLISQLAGSPHATGLFGWEAEHRAIGGYRLRRTIHTVITVVTFCGPGIVAMLMSWSTIATSPAMAALVIVEIAALAGLGHQVLTNVDSRPDTAHEPG